MPYKDIIKRGAFLALGAKPVNADLRFENPKAESTGLIMLPKTKANREVKVFLTKVTKG